MQNHNQPSSGFALLLTLVVVSVVISIGLTLLELTVKQLRLSTGTKDSENAFHAANAGVECVRYWRIATTTSNDWSLEFENGTESSPGVSNVPMQCFGSGIVYPTLTDLSPGSSELMFKYDVEFTWGAATAQRCSKMSFITLSSDPASTGVTLSNISTTHMPGYPYTDKSCIAGGRCTIVSVQGYNQPCTSVGTLGTVQREVLLEL